MTEASTKQHDHPRSVADDTLQLLNLKIDNNFYEYIVLIVGIDDHHYLVKNLSSIISKDRLYTFNDVAISLTFIRSIQNINIFLIISGTLGKDSAQEFTRDQQILGLYIYCIDEMKHTIWTKGIEKTRCVVSDPTQLIIQLHSDIKQLSGRWPFDERSFEKTSTITSQWYHLFLLVICYRSQDMKNSYQEMFNECRKYYKSNPFMIRQIEQLAQTYKPTNAIHEYTLDSFLYRIVNHALRTQNMEIITKFSPFIRDLHCQLYHYHQMYYRANEQSIRTVYRGQSLSLDELKYLSLICQSKRPIIILTTFSSASLDPEVAMNFVSPVKDRIPCLFEIIITDEYNIEHQHKIDHEQVFANISSLSTMPDEQEVLFSLVTHFRVKHVEYPVNRSYRPWTSVTLELISDTTGKCSINHFDVVDAIKRETNPQVYTDILYLLRKNASDEIHSNTINWDKWWSCLSKKWGTNEARDVPLLLTMYSCFTDNPYWSRKAIEMHKHILRSHPDIQANHSSISYLFGRCKVFEQMPTRWLALYEDYLGQLCTTNTKEVCQCLYFAGHTYERIADKEHALQCYRKLLDMNVDDRYNMNNNAQKRINILEKPCRTISTTINESITIVNDIDKVFTRTYEAQEEQWSCYWTIKRGNIDKPHIGKRLKQLLIYLQQRHQWYDVADAKILLRVSGEHTEGLSVNDYRSYFLSAVKKHRSLSNQTTDTTNYCSLFRWRYEKYMCEWILFKELENFLKPFQEKSMYILPKILRQLRQLTKKLNVLITLCIVYIINATNIDFIDRMDTTIKRLVFFDHHDAYLLADLKAFVEESLITEPATIINEDEWKNSSGNDTAVADFLRECIGTN